MRNLNFLAQHFGILKFFSVNLHIYLTALSHCYDFLFTSLMPFLQYTFQTAKRVCSCGRNHGQRKTSPISWQPSLLRTRGGLDSRKTAGRDYDEAGKMQIGKKTANRRSLRQASQHCGVFLQVALPFGFHLSQYCLLDLFRWNCGLRTSRFHLAR